MASMWLTKQQHCKQNTPKELHSRESTVNFTVRTKLKHFRILLNSDGLQTTSWSTWPSNGFRNQESAT